MSFGVGFQDIIAMTARYLTSPGDKPKFSEADIWQFVKTGMRRTQQLMRARGLKEMTASAEVTVPAGQASIDATEVGAYWLITKALRIWERPTSDALGFVQMRYVSPLPLNQQPGDYLRLWDLLRLDDTIWQIQFPAACTRNMVLRITGPCELFINNATVNQSYYLNNTQEPVALFAAAYACQSYNPKLGETLERQGMEFMDGLAAEDIHQRQLQPGRMYAVRSGLRDRWW